MISWGDERMNPLRRTQRFMAIGLCAIGLTACQQVSTLFTPPDPASFKSATGPHSVGFVESLTLSFEAQDKDLLIQVSYPQDQSEPAPLIVFSHGALCSKNTYSSIVNHWVSHGYVVIEPTHIDSGTLGETKFMDLGWIADTRPGDMSFILDSLDDIEAAIPELAGKIDRSRIAASGHSMGAATAQRATGLDTRSAKGSVDSLTDDRFDIALLLSAPGKMSNIPDNSWDEYEIPMMMSTGTKDITMTNKNRPEGWAWRLGSFELTPRGDKYVLITQDMDHFLGGHICRPEGDKGPDDEALAIVGGATTAFLDAYLKEDVAAKRFIKSNAVNELSNGRAEMKSR